MRKREVALVLLIVGLVLVACKSNMTNSDNGPNEQETTAESRNEKDLGDSSVESTEDTEDTVSSMNEEEQTLAESQKEAAEEDINTEDEYKAAKTYWLGQGMEVPDYDRALIMRDVLELHYPKDGMFVFAKGTPEGDEIEDEMNAAGTSKEELEEDWLDELDVLIFPKKYNYDNFQYFGYVQINYHMLEEGVNISELKNSGSEKLEDIINQTKEYMDIEEMDYDIINGIEYANSSIQTPHGIGYLYLTIQDGSLFIFFFDSYNPHDNLQEMINFKNYIMDSVYLVDDEM